LLAFGSQKLTYSQFIVGLSSMSIRNPMLVKSAHSAPTDKALVARFWHMHIVVTGNLFSVLTWRIGELRARK